MARVGPNGCRLTAEGARRAASAAVAVSLRRDGALGGSRCGGRRRRPRWRLEAPRLRYRAQASRDRRATQPRRAGGGVVRRCSAHCRRTPSRSVMTSRCAFNRNSAEFPEAGDRRSTVAHEILAHDVAGIYRGLQSALRARGEALAEMLPACRVGARG